MILALQRLRRIPHGLPVALLVLVLGVLPGSEARAGEPDYEAVGSRLEAAVHAGELTAAQAQAMMGALAEARFAERMAAAAHPPAKKPDLVTMGRKIRAAVAAGKLTEDEGRAKMEAYERSFRAHHDRVDATRARVVSEEAASAREASYLARIKARAAEVEDQRKKALAARDALRASLRTKEGAIRPAGIEAYYERIGVDKEALERVRGVLGQQGFSDEQTQQALGALLRLTMAVRHQGDAFEMDPRMREHLERMEFDEAQIGILVRVAKRLAAASPRAEPEEEGGAER